MFLAAFTSALQANPQAVHRKTAWLSRDFRSTCLHAEQHWLVNAGLIFSTRPDAFCSRRRTSRPHPDARMPRFRTAFWRTFRPGAAAVPLTDRVMALIFRSSALWLPVRMLLDGEVPHVPGMRAVALQHRLLGGRGDQLVPGHTNTLATTTDISAGR